MDKIEGIEHVESALLANSKLGNNKDKNIRKTITSELQELGVSQTTSYEWYREAHRNFSTEKANQDNSYQAMHPLELLEKAEDIMWAVDPQNDPEGYIKAQKHYASLLSKFKHQITYRNYETN